MILYYAMGGGLGHLSRSLAILQELPQALREQVRLLASSRHAALVVQSAPCPVDIVAGELLTSRRAYLRFLEEYIDRYEISALVLDTFPFGIVGEWLDVGTSLPRALIARNVTWDAYQERIRHRDSPFPQHALVIERLSAPYWDRLQQASRLSRLDAPITLREWEESLLGAGLLASRDDALRRSRTSSTLRVEWTQSVGTSKTPLLGGIGGGLRSSTNSSAQSPTPCPSQEGNGASVLIVHSGNERERQVLRQVARQEKLPEDTRDEIFPEQGIYPAERIMARYETIVAAAGYNMVALASQAPPAQRFILHPFPRRFDDQFLRLKRFKQGQWPWQQGCGKKQAARWLVEILRG